MTTGLKIAIGVVGALALVVGAGAPVGKGALKVATGYGAKRVCSEHWVAHRPAADAISVDISFLPVPVTITVDEEAHQVTARSVGGVKQVAVFREGLGCVVAAKVKPESLASQTLTLPPAVDQYPASPFLDGVDPGTPLHPGIDRAALAAAIDFAFEEPDPNALRRTRGVVVAHRGRIVAERYAEGFDASTPLLGWSMTKSVTAAMVGVAVQQGRMSITDTTGFPEWAGTDREPLTLDQLMRMSSGLGFDEDYGAFGDATQMLYKSADMTEYAASFDLEHPIDTHWSYSSATTNLIQRALHDRLGSDYLDFPHTQLFRRIGINSAILETDPAGIYVGSSYAWMTARDWARFGQLHLQDGLWKGDRVLPENWRAYVCTPTPDSGGLYGAQWWLNQGLPEGQEGTREYPDVPADACSAQGFETQRVMVIPSHDLVVVRLGLTFQRGAFDTNAWVSQITAAIPADLPVQEAEPEEALEPEEAGAASEAAEPEATVE